MNRIFQAVAIIGLMVCFVPNLIAQKNVNVDNQRFTYRSRNLPASPLSPRSFYYAVNLSLAAGVKSYVDESMLIEGINIDGQRYTEEPKPEDVFVNVAMAPISIDNSIVKDRYVEDKDKNGRVTKRTYYYWVEINYSFEAHVIVIKDSKEVLKYSPITRRNVYSFKSGEYSTGKQASDYWKNNKDILKEKFTRECSSEAAKLISGRLSNQYGFAISVEPALIKTINEKKHPENDALRAMSQSIEDKVKALTGTVPLTESDMAEEIDYFKGLLTKYTDEKLKADIRLRYVAYYNLCRIYIYMDQPENVREYAELLIANGHDKKDGERLVKDADKLLERFNGADIKSRQFDPNLLFTE